MAFSSSAIDPPTSVTPRFRDYRDTGLGRTKFKIWKGADPTWSSSRNPFLAPGTPATPQAPKPLYRDYKATGAAAGVGRGLFRRLRSAGAFTEGSALRDYNPYLPEGQAGWKDNPLQRFAGPARQKPTIGNVTGAVSGILEGDRAKREDAYKRMLDQILSGREALDAQGRAVTTALNTPPISPEMLEHQQAQARERVASEGGLRRSSLAAQLAGQGMRLDDLNPSYAAMEGGVLFDLSQAEADTENRAAVTNRDALMKAIEGASGFGGNLSTMIQSLLSTEEFRNQISADDVAFLETMAGLRKAGQ